MERTDQSASRITRFTRCGCNAWVYKSVPSVGEARFKVNAAWCKDRLCPHCSANRSVIATSRITRLAQAAPAASLRFLTLTLKHTDSKLDLIMDRLTECFRRLRQRKAWKKHVVGGVAAIEVKLSERGQWHVHLHAIIEGVFWLHRDIREEWLAVTGDSSIVDIRPADTEHARYVAKYVGKPIHSLCHLPEDRLDQAVTAFRGRRLLVAFGTWFRKIREDELDCDPDETHPDTAEPMVWEPVAPLAELVERAARGDPWARGIIDQLRPGSTLADLLTACSGGTS